MDKDDLLELALGAEVLKVEDLKINGDQLELKISARIDRQSLAKQLIESLGPEIYKAMRWQLATGEIPQNENAEGSEEDYGLGDDASEVAEDADDSRYGEPESDVEWHALMGGATNYTSGESTVVLDGQSAVREGNPIGRVENHRQEVNQAEAEIEAKRAYAAAGPLQSTASTSTPAAHDETLPLEDQPQGEDEQALSDMTSSEASTEVGGGTEQPQATAKKPVADEGQQGSGNEKIKTVRRLRVSCPKCGEIIEQPEDKAGAVITCRKCGKAMRLSIPVK